MKKSIFIAALVLSIPIAAAEPEKEGLKNDSFTTPCQDAQRAIVRVQKKTKQLLEYGFKKSSQAFEQWALWLQGSNEESELEPLKAENEKRQQLLKSDEEYAKKVSEELNK